MSERVEARGAVHLGWPGGRPRRPDRVIERALEAIEALRPALRPTMFQINLRLRGSDDLPDRWLWSLEERGFEDGEESEAGGEVVFRLADRVDLEAMRALAREALAEAGGQVDVSSISVEVRSSRPGARPIEMEIWALSDLSIDMDWPLGDGGEPSGEVEQAVERLVALGWEVDDEPADLALAEEEDGPPRRGLPVALQLVWTGARPADPLAAAGLAIEAAWAFAAVAPPSSAVIEVAFADLARVRPDRHRFSIAERRLAIDAARALAREALAPQKPAGLAGRLRGHRAVDWVGIEIGLAGGDPAPDPLHLSFSQRPALHLEIQLRTADHADPGSTGRDRIERVVAGLARAGWKRAPDRA